MAAVSAFGVTQHSQTFSLFFRNRIQCIALYQLHNSQALLNLRRGYYTIAYCNLRNHTLMRVQHHSHTKRFTVVIKFVIKDKANQKLCNLNDFTTPHHRPKNDKG